MIKRLTTAFNHFQGKFTYRQRFLFFALLFFIGALPPIYISLKLENYYIDTTNERILGNELQRP